MKPMHVVFVMIVLGAVFGCLRTEHKIEAHITLDIRQIREDAGGMLDFIEGKTDTPPAKDEKSNNSSWLQPLHNWLAFSTPVYAESLKNDSPEIRQILQRLRERNTQIQSLKSDKLVGENNRGYLEFRPSDALNNPQKKNEVQRTVSDENTDRKSLYAEVVRLNADSGATLSTIERVYAQERLMRVKSGEMVQLPPAGKDFNEFKASESGKRLGDACVPEAWVTIP